MYFDQLPPPRIGGPGFTAAADDDPDAEALAVAEPEGVFPGDTTPDAAGDGGVVCCAMAGDANASVVATITAQRSRRSRVIGAQC
jgi:hypothetical protein